MALEKYSAMAKRLTEADYVQDTRTVLYATRFYFEYYGYICCDRKSGIVSATGPARGKYVYDVGSQMVVLTPEQESAPWTFPGAHPMSDPSDPLVQCKAPAIPVLFYHSHPPNSAGDGLSPQDRATSDGSQVPHAAVVDGGIDVYIPTSGVRIWIEVP